MARTQFTFTFTNAQPGADVGFNFPAYADNSTTVQDGTMTGADPGATQGAAVLYLVTATPA